MFGNKALTPYIFGGETELLQQTQTLKLFTSVERRLGHHSLEDSSSQYSILDAPELSVPGCFLNSFALVCKVTAWHDMFQGKCSTVITWTSILVGVLIRNVIFKELRNSSGLSVLSDRKFSIAFWSMKWLVSQVTETQLPFLGHTCCKRKTSGKGKKWLLQHRLSEARWRTSERRQVFPCKIVNAHCAYLLFVLLKETVQIVSPFIVEVEVLTLSFTFRPNHFGNRCPVASMFY